MSAGGGARPRALAVPLDAATRAGADGEWLVWRVRGAENLDQGFVRGEAAAGCLRAFLALERAPLADFPAFMRRRGVLGICAAHGRPGVHGGCAPRGGALAGDLFPRTSLTEGWTTPLRIYQEPAAAWRELAATLGAALRVGAALRAGEGGAPADLARLFGGRDAGASVEAQRARLAEAVAGWQAEAEAPDAGAGGFAWPARSLYPELLGELREALADGGGSA